MLRVPVPTRRGSSACATLYACFVFLSRLDDNPHDHALHLERLRTCYHWEGSNKRGIFPWIGKTRESRYSDVQAVELLVMHLILGRAKVRISGLVEVVDRGVCRHVES